MRTVRGTTLAALVVAMAGFMPLRAADEAGPLDAKAAFERLKGLVGTWEGEAFGQTVTVVFRLTGAGSALVETQFPGTEHEMVSVYHMDGDDLRMTHYCAVGNQPRVKLAKDRSKADDLVFDFDGGTNLNPDKDHYIHDVRIQFKDADHIESRWASWADGKPSEHVADFALTRKK
jgi:hypothetical protein